MMNFIKLYDWIADTELPAEERIVLAIINQFSEGDKTGFWAGFKEMAVRTGIPKARCKQYTEHLIEIGAVTKHNEVQLHKTRLVLKTSPDFVSQFIEG